MKSRLLLVFVLTLFSCNSTGSKNNSMSNEGFTSCSDSTFFKFIKTNSSITIATKFKELIHDGNDSCTLNFLKIVVSNYIKHRDIKSFQDLNQISCLLDGYLSELFVDYIPKFIENDNGSFFSQLFSERSKVASTKCLEEVIVNYMQLYDVDSSYEKCIRKLIKKTKDDKFALYLNGFL